MQNNDKEYKFIGKSDVAFENGNIYEAEPVTNELGDFITVKDESREWYNYDVDFFNENFVLVDKN